MQYYTFDTSVSVVLSTTKVLIQIVIPIVILVESTRYCTSTDCSTTVVVYLKYTIATPSCDLRRTAKGNWQWSREKMPSN